MAPPKGSRRAPSSLSTVTTMTPTTNPARSSKSNRPSKVIQLKVPAAFLSAMSGEDEVVVETKGTPQAKPIVKSSSSSSSTSGLSIKLKTGGDSTPSNKGGDGEDVQSPEKSVEPATEENEKSGLKRDADAAAGSDDPSKAKAKVPQRKRPKVGENGRLDGRTSAARAAGFVPGAHKLGPKANLGAINEKLRALDRTNKPCRKWAKSGFKLKSFTGQVWEMPTWHSPHTRTFGAGPNGAHLPNKEAGKENSSSNVGSDHQSPAVGPIDGASSPAVVAVA